MSSLTDIEGIGACYAEKLRAIGVTSQENLLLMGATRSGRAALAEESGISAKLLLKWVNHTDLARVQGICCEYAELLQRAGVENLPELAWRKHGNLHNRIACANEDHKLVEVLPSAGEVEQWVTEARVLDRRVQY